MPRRKPAIRAGKPEETGSGLGIRFKRRAPKGGASVSGRRRQITRRAKFNGRKAIAAAATLVRPSKKNDSALSKAMSIALVLTGTPAREWRVCTRSSSPEAAGVSDPTTKPTMTVAVSKSTGGLYPSRRKIIAERNVARTSVGTFRDRAKTTRGMSAVEIALAACASPIWKKIKAKRRMPLRARSHVR
jgi:hypothetical protein